MKPSLLLLSSALFLAACSGNATISASNTRFVGPSSIQVHPAANAGSDVSDITARPNPPVEHGQAIRAGTLTARVAMTQLETKTVSPSLGTAIDRCGFGSSGPANHAGTRSRHLPQPMCAPE